MGQFNAFSAAEIKSAIAICVAAGVPGAEQLVQTLEEHLRERLATYAAATQGPRVRPCDTACPECGRPMKEADLDGVTIRACSCGGCAYSEVV